MPAFVFLVGVFKSLVRGKKVSVRSSVDRTLGTGVSHGTHRTTTHGHSTPSLRDAPSEEGVGRLSPPL